MAVPTHNILDTTSVNSTTESPEHLATEAKAILRRNDKGGYTVPTDTGLYPAQWNWDSCLVALGFAQFDIARAWAEINTLLSGQWNDGMIPSILFHGDDSSYFPNSAVWDTGKSVRSSGITQPPVAATAVRYIYEHTHASERLERLRSIAPRLLKAHCWLYAARGADGSGMVSIIHPGESGMDNSPAWDGALAAVPEGRSVAELRRDLGFVSSAARPTDREYNRYMSLVSIFRDLRYDPEGIWRTAPFLVADIGFNAILMRANRDLVYLLEQVDDAAGVHQIEELDARARAAVEANWAEHDGFYYSLDRRTNKLIRKPSVGSFLPLYSDDSVSKRHPCIVERLEQWLRAVRFGVPSYRPGDPEFDARWYWRGPVWLVVNWMLVDGLTRNGFLDLASTIKQHSLELVARSGFAEYFDPFTGEALGGRNFSWTAAMTLMLQSK
jgi:hypothetical protein